MSVEIDTCKALGLDPERVNWIAIDMSVGSAPKVTVGMFLVDDGKLTEHLANYRLTWAPPTGPPTIDPFGFLEG